MSEYPSILDFSCLTMASLRNYAEIYGIDIADGDKHAQIAETIQRYRHFISLEINEQEIINNLNPRLRQVGNELRNMGNNVESDRRKIKKPKKYGEDDDYGSYYQPKVRDNSNVKSTPLNEMVVSTTEQDTTLYCICQKPATGDMIGCDNENCPYKWFHYACLNLDPEVITKDPWFCPMCSQAMERK